MVRIRKKQGRTLPSRLKPSKEGVLENWARTQARKGNLKFWKLQLISNRGAPDRLVVGFNGRQAYVEFKRSEKHQLSALQAETRQELLDRGQRVYVVHTKEHVSQVFAWLITGGAPPQVSEDGRPKPRRKT